MASLFCTAGPALGTRYPLDRPVLMLGRSGTSDIKINDPRASRSHARVRAEGDRHILEDLQGRVERGGGTFVNGRAITWHMLQDDDVISIAGTTFRFELEEPVEPTERMQLQMVHEANERDSHVPIYDTVEAAQNPVNAITAAAGSTPALLAEAHERLRTIYEVSNAIGSILDQTQLYDAILTALDRVFRHASRMVLLTLDRKTGELVERAEKTQKPTASPRKIPISRKVMSEVIEHKRALIFGGANVTNTSFTGMLTHSMLCAPLCVRGEVLGVIHLTSRDLITPFVRADLDLLVGIANQAAIAMQNAEMHVELLARERLKHDMEIAQEVQRRFLPLAPPRIHGWSFATEYRPAFAVGGDFYDFVQHGDSRVSVLIGDVAGKGVSAALLMARVTSEFRTLAMIESSPDAVMAHVNRSLVAAGYEGVFVTACFMVINLETNELSYCNAGHLPPLVRRSTGSLDRLETGDLALGVLDDTQFTQETVSLGPGDLVVLMSDGVVESTSSEREQIGFRRIEDVLRESTGDADATLEHLLAAIREFVGDASQYDDLTTVCFSRENEDVPSTDSRFGSDTNLSQATVLGWVKQPR